MDNSFTVYGGVNENFSCLNYGKIEELGELGPSMRTNEISISFMKRGSAVVVGPKNEDAISLYKDLI